MPQYQASNWRTQNNEAIPSSADDWKRPVIPVQPVSTAITNEQKYSEKQLSGRILAACQELAVFSITVNQLSGNYVSKQSLDIVLFGGFQWDQENHTSIKRQIVQGHLWEVWFWRTLKLTESIGGQRKHKRWRRLLSLKIIAHSFKSSNQLVRVSLLSVI